LSTGVPQGSVLGPVLFSVYVSELASIFHKHDVKYVSYADDFQIFVSTSPPKFDEALKKLENCIDEVREWLSANHLVLNDNKTEFIFFGNRQQLRKLQPHHLRVGSSTINPSTVVRNLGVLFDRELKFDKHVTKTCQTAYAYLRIINRAKSNLNSRTITLAVNSLVLSRIDYCIALMVGISNKLLKQLDRIIKVSNSLTQQRLPIANGAPHSNTHLTVEKRISLRLTLLTHTAIISGQPKYIVDFYKPTQSNSLRSSSNNALNIPFARTETGKRAFAVASVWNWNTLPPSVRNKSSRETFYSTVKQHLSLS
jgi:hypothetical protein